MIVVADTSVILNLCFLGHESLLPVLFDGHHRHPRRCWPSNAQCAQEESVRGWLMGALFPGLDREFLAWQTAVPTLRLNGALRVLLGDAMHASTDGGGGGGSGGCSSQVLALELARPAPSTRRPVVMDTAALETMAELTHPKWGLPLLVGPTVLHDTPNRKAAAALALAAAMEVRNAPVFACS